MIPPLRRHVMIRKLALVAALAFSFSLAAPNVLACPGHNKEKQADKEKAAPKKLASATFRVDGMHCEGCSEKVKTALGAKDGIVKVLVTLESKRITVDYDAAKLTVDQIAKMITELGYKATAEA
jgi:copper chaperone